MKKQLFTFVTFLTSPIIFAQSSDIGIDDKINEAFTPIADW